MEGRKISFFKIFDARLEELHVPVYQRKYSWQKQQCYQLFNDLLRLKNESASSPNAQEVTHFMGAIVTESKGRDKVFIIDGQQRITSISLLILAALYTWENGKLKVREGNKPREEDYSFYLKTWVHEPKLHLIEEDDKVYQQLLKGEIERLSDSNHNLVNNYKYFCQLLEANAEDFTFDDLLDTLDKLEIIHILLGTHDDAQLIFESLNSTGLALTEADKIRNYMLMALPAEDQTTYYKEYWTQIEEYTNAAPTLFFRDYLTIKKELGKPVKISDIYYEWKKYMAERDRKKEIVQIHTYAEYYHKVTTGKGIKKTTISKQIAEISTLKITVANSFFIQFLKYADDQELTPAQITEVLDVMENVFVRRIICEYNTNALSQITCSLHRNILERLTESTKKTPAAPTTYTEILKAYLLKYIPKDEEFAEKIKTRHLYNILKPHLYFILDRLENKFETETNTVISDLKNKKISIEHILPQKLNEHWRSELGENWEEIHKNTYTPWPI